MLNLIAFVVCITFAVLLAFAGRFELAIMDAALGFMNIPLIITWWKERKERKKKKDD